MKGRDKRRTAKVNAQKRKGVAPCKNKPSHKTIERIAAKVADLSRS